MALEIRTISSDEIEQAQMISMYAFGSSDRFNPGQAIEQTKRFFQPDWHLCAFEDGEMTSMMRMLPFAMRINGRALPFAAVGPVANSPLHRRKGHTGALLRKSLEVMRERGQWLSGLYTPHPAFYRRYGWEVASDERLYTFKPKDCHLAAEPSQRGQMRWVRPDEWQELDRVYRHHSAQRNGPLHRGEVWWRNSVLNETGNPRSDAAIWETDAGEPQGYVVFFSPTQGEDAGRIVTREFAAATPDAYLNLITFLAQHDIYRDIKVMAPSDDPLPLLFTDAERLQIAQHYSVMLRIVDVEAALRSHPLADPTTEAAFTLQVRDGSAPWNEGTYAVRAAEGVATVERVEGDGQLAIDARALAPVFNGYVTPSQAAGSGLLQVREESALPEAARFFAVSQRPYFPDRF